MTLIKISFVKNNVRKKSVVQLQCDFCGEQYTCRDDTKNRALKQELHFCTKLCSVNAIKNGKLYDKIKKIQTEKYGSYFVGTQSFKDEQKQVCMKKYGTESRLEAKEILDKIKQTNIQKYGKEIFAGSQEHIKKLDYVSIAAKAWTTKILNGTCSRSAPEERVNKILTKTFGVSDIIRQQELIGQWIDFYIKSIDTYIQVDGVYWHGLNRKFSEIKLQKTAQDQKIYKQILRDRKLNKYMKKNNMKLVRITDAQVKKMTSEELISIIKEK